MAKPMKFIGILSIYTCELNTIRADLDYMISKHDITNENILVWNDSLSSLQSLETGKSISRPELLTKYPVKYERP